MKQRHALSSVFLLCALILGAQTVLAWHAPSHLADIHSTSDHASAQHGKHHQNPLHDNHDCPLGINSHGVALLQTPPHTTNPVAPIRANSPYCPPAGVAPPPPALARGPPLIN
jgi:hypothetical protein